MNEQDLIKWNKLWKRTAKKWFERGEVAEGLNVACEIALYKMRKELEELKIDYEEEKAAREWCQEIINQNIANMKILKEKIYELTNTLLEIR